MNKKAGLRGIILVITGLFLAGNAWSDEQYWVNPDGTFKCELAPGSNIPCPSIIISGTNGDRAYADSGSNCCNHGSNGTCTYTGYSYQTTTAIPGSGRSPSWRRAWQPTPVFLLGKPMDKRTQQATVHGVAKIGHA